jgi:hypothetical protein
MQSAVGIFKTSVEDHQQAALLLILIQTAFPGSFANFDLEDCDHVLRVHSPREQISPDQLIQLFLQHGFYAAELEDVVPS